MKIQILVRFEPLSDWYEIYINEKFVYDGEHPLDTTILSWLAENTDIEIEIRYFTIDPEELVGALPAGSYAPPLHSLDGNNYWHDWERANVNSS